MNVSTFCVKVAAYEVEPSIIFFNRFSSIVSNILSVDLKGGAGIANDIFSKHGVTLLLL